MKYKLEDLIDIAHFQTLQDRLDKIYSFPSSIIDNDGKILTATAWQDVCKKFHRKNRECEKECIKSDQYILDHMHEANPAVTYRCPHGLVDNAMPIIIDGVHYGNFFTGQFLLAEPDLAFFRAQAKKYGFHEEAYIEAVKKVPVWTREQLNSYLLFIKELIAVISDSGLKKLSEIENRKQIEESEKRHRSILKSAMDGFWLTDTKGRLLDVNDAYCSMSGYSEEELLSMGISDLEAVEDADEVAEHMQKLIRKGSDRFESKHRRKDGTFFDVEVSIQFRPGEGGQCVCFLRDITERKNAEEALRREKEKAQSYLDLAGVIFVAINTDGIVTLINKKGCEVLGYAVEDIIGKNWFDNFIPERLRNDLIPVSRQLLNGDIDPFEYYENPILTKSGEERIIAWHNAIIKNEAGKITGHLSSGEDITEQKAAEQALLEAIQKYQSMVENIGIGVALIGKNMEIIELNRQMRQWFPKVDPTTKPLCYQAFNDPPSDTICDWCPTCKTLIDGKVHESITQTPGAGGVRNFRIVSSPIIDSNGDTTAAIEMVEDITEQLKLEEQLRNAQRMESIGNLAGGIAHDFNNILFPIIGMSEMLLEDMPLDSPERESAEEILKAGKRGGDLVKQILAFSRQSDHQMVPTRIQRVLRDVLKLTRASIPSFIEIDQDIQPDCGLIMADPTQIHQVSMNIITNAYHAVEKEGGRIFVELKQVDLAKADLPDAGMNAGAYAVLSVSDNGHGIPPDLMDNIFDPYFTTKAQGKGTGLGLAVVYGIVQEHEGNITVRSRTGEGTTFRVYLPLMEKSEAIEPVEETRLLPTGTEHILLVDDEEPIVKLETKILERLGYQVTSRISSVEALEAFRSQPDFFDLVITDMTMPNLTGDQLARKIREVRSDIPIIICTGFSEKLDQEKAEALRINGLLMKPIVKADMAQMVRRVLDGAKGKAQK